MDSPDWYDYEKVKKFNDKRSIQMRNLVKKINKEKANGDELGIKKAYINLIKQQKQEEIYRKKAEEAGYCWV